MSATDFNLRDLLHSILVTTDSEDQGARSPARRLSRLSRLPAGKRSDAEAYLKPILDRIAPFYLADEKGKYVAFSSAFSEMHSLLFDFDIATARQNEVPAVLTKIHDSLRSNHADVRRKDELFDDGRRRILYSTHFPILNSNNEPIGFGGIYEDVTPTSRAVSAAGEMENWLRDVIRSTSDWIWAVDRNFNLTFVSPRISEILDEPAQRLVGRHLFSLGEFDDSMPLATATRKDIEERFPFRSRMFLMKGKSGKTYRVLLSGIPVFEDSSGRFTGYRGTGTDITRRYEAEQQATETTARLKDAYDELCRKNEELARALERSQIGEKTKVDFLAMMSHELKTPLNSIIGFSDAAIQKIHGPLNKSYDDYFQNIHKAGQHLLAIISDLLEAANMDHQDLTVRAEPVRIQDLVNEAISLVNLQSVKGKIDTSGLGVDTDLVVVADHLRARQIIVNLIGNALKFTPDGGKIGIDIDQQPNDLVSISVWDTGIGIPLEEQARVFDRFYQVEKNILSRGREGTGLGLSISQYLARRMKGDLTLSSVPGEGSRFSLILPAAASDR